MVGISVQEVFIVLFAILAIRFQAEMNRVELKTPSPYPWRSLLYSLYVGLLFITMRILFRLIENGGGPDDTYVLDHEVYLYCLEAIPMLISMALYNIMHPGAVLVGPDSEFPKDEEKGPWWWGWWKRDRYWSKSKPRRHIDSTGSAAELVTVSRQYEIP